MHEIERKFLVVGDAWRTLAEGTLLRQGYLSSVTERVVRVRTAGSSAFLTVKGRTHGITRLEFEYAIPLADATRMLDDLCERPLIEKTRYRVPYAGATWDLDEFHGENAGLVLAEIELATPDAPFERPPWVGLEVSSDVRYFNTALAHRPFATWGR